MGKSQFFFFKNHIAEFCEKFGRDKCNMENIILGKHTGIIWQKNIAIMALRWSRIKYAIKHIMI